MKKAAPPKLLRLDTTTVRALGREPLANVQGGVAPRSAGAQTCVCPPGHDE